MRRIATLVLVTAALAATAAVALAAQSPKALSGSIVAAARAQRSVHWTATEVIGSVALTTGTDAGKTKGVQHVTFAIGKQRAHVKIIVAGGVAYVRGDALGLQLNLSLTTAQAKKYAGAWISIPKLDPAYAPTAAGDTMDTVVSQLAPHGRLSLISGKLHGIRVIGVRGVSGSGTKKTAEVLITRAHGKRLPLEQDIVSPGKHAIGHTAFSKWNETVQVTAPASSTPIAAVRAT
jgi:hypothetical protein